MPKRRSGAATLLLLGSALVFCPIVAATPLEDALRERWLGAWVILRAEAGSDCGSLYTNNKVVNGRTVHRADYGLPAGELGKIVKLDAKRARVDVFVDLVEPLRTSRIEGPFELFDQLACRVELQFETPRAVVRKGDVAAATEILARLLERYESREGALQSAHWNRRQAEPLPAGYQETLFEYERWRETQLVFELQDRLDRELDEAADIVERARRSEDYALGLAAGLGRSRSSSLSRDCEALPEESFYALSGSAPESVDERDWKAGYRDGQRLAFSIELADRLQVCLR